jgi:dTDP-4-dehydrorhamnose reductase
VTRTRRRVELWGGVECTVNRVGNEFLDQLELSGHDRRPEDLERFAELGLTALRYPVLWERTAPDGLDTADWTFADERLPLIRGLGMRPIVGLVHHGSGPRSTSLVDDSFADGLADFAGAVAARFPWVDEWTPVNEPLTTARFSALYGHWYPHLRDDAAFARAVVVQCRAVVLAMARIRAVNPKARLVQTEDVGTVHTTPPLAYQGVFENERRWLTFDLLCGRVDESHFLWPWLRAHGIRADELRFFVDTPCPPDVVGINHYLTSERFLDHRLERYPLDVHGGNGIDAYADVDAWHALPEPPAGARGALEAAWSRYRLPLAITESHNACTREEQLRWVREVWGAAVTVADGGADVRAVTLWSLLGAHGWNELVRRRGGRYEPGVFDLRGPAPRPTALAGLARSLAAGHAPDSPLFSDAGWWRRRSEDGRTERRRRTRPLLITGANGTLGRELALHCRLRAIEHVALARGELDVASPAAVDAAVDDLRPWAVVNAAGYVRVDDAETDAARCFRDNVDASSVLARACAARGLPLVAYSSDLVFDGEAGTPYLETDAVGPLNVYGRSKARGEEAVLAAHPQALVVRTSAFFGPHDAANFVTSTLERLAAGEHVVAADDAVVSPTYVPDLVEASLDLLVDGETGLWHLANDGATTWADLARAAAARFALPPRIVGRPTAALALAAPRPLFSALGSSRGTLLPPLDDALARYAAARAA